ncbi:MAG TPA: hypothetical protein PKN33_03150 [Phycisphaerae bacterium]|nr:hypothetical protein [Phycisphaerae bacterium]
MTIDTKIIASNQSWFAKRNQGSFTLIETLAVTVLLALLIGTTVVNMPGATQRQRLDATLAIIANADQIARTQALADGRPRMLVFPSDNSRAEIRGPVLTDESIKWASQLKLRFPDQVRVVGLVIEGSTELELTIEVEQADSNAETDHRITIRGDGRSSTYAVLCEAAENIRGAVVIDGRTGLSRIVDIGAFDDIDIASLNTEGLLCE